MTRKCQLTDEGGICGNTVSHAHNKRRRRFLPNLQKVSLYSEALGKSLKLKVKVSTLRSIEAKGGVDRWLAAVRRPNPQVKRLQARLAKAAPTSFGDNKESRSKPA